MTAGQENTNAGWLIAYSFSGTSNGNISTIVAYALCSAP
jgi:hypothetical protein